jgi:hypothetical protein
MKNYCYTLPREPIYNDCCKNSILLVMYGFLALVALSLVP